MSKVVNNIYKIHNNPFVFAPLIVSFFKYCHPQSKNILLTYLVLPLILYETSRKSLINANTRSSISTFIRKKENFFGLQDRVSKYKTITNQCIQYAIDNNYIEIKDDLSVTVLNDKLYTVSSLKHELLASSKLYKIFQEQDVVTIYKLLGVKEL